VKGWLRKREAWVVVSDKFQHATSVAPFTSAHTKPQDPTPHRGWRPCLYQGIWGFLPLFCPSADPDWLCGQVKWPKVPFCKRILPVHPHRLIHEHWCAARMLTSFSLLVIQRCIPHRRTQCKVTCTNEHTWEAVPVRGAPPSNQCARIVYVHASKPEVRREGYRFSSDRRREGDFSSPLD